MIFSSSTVAGIILLVLVVTTVVVWFITDARAYQRTAFWRGKYEEAKMRRLRWLPHYRSDDRPSGFYWRFDPVGTKPTDIQHLPYGYPRTKQETKYWQKFRWAGPLLPTVDE